jgi:4-amino-4-deoxy-L-arabinose transferase-like glycosyltransferase
MMQRAWDSTTAWHSRLWAHESGAWRATGRQVALGLGVFAAVWLALLGFVNLTPPTDNIEQLTWVRSLEWGYYKHPPLPTWLFWLPVKLFGLSAATSYAMGAACTLGAMAVMWQLLTRLRGSTYATVALLAALCITYYNGRLHYYNHNVVLLLLSTACATLCWQAFATRHLRWWLALGLVLGLGALAKYQIAITGLCVAVFALHQRAWREPVHRLGAVMASLIALTVFAPHIEWLRRHDFVAIRYAVDTSLGAGFSASKRLATASIWLIDQVANRALPALILLWVAARSQRSVRVLAPGHGPTRPGDAARALLLIWGWTPLLFMPLMGLVAGSDLPLHWGTPFLPFLVPATMELLRSVVWQRVKLAKVGGAFVLVQCLLMVTSQITSTFGRFAARDRLGRGFDSTQLAQRIAEPARAALGGPIRVVSGNAVLAGALALRLREQPLVLISGRFDQSPWVEPELVRRCGMVEIGPMQSLPAGTPLGPPWPDLAWRAVGREASAAACPVSP